MYKIEFQNYENGVLTDIVAYNTSENLYSFSNGLVGRFYIDSKIVDTVNEVTNELSNESGKEVIISSKRELYNRFVFPVSNTQIQSMQFLELVSDITITDIDGNIEQVDKVRVSSIEDTDVAGIKIITLDILNKNNIVLIGSSYN